MPNNLVPVSPFPSWGVSRHRRDGVDAPVWEVFINEENRSNPPSRINGTRESTPPPSEPPLKEGNGTAGTLLWFPSWGVARHRRDGVDALRSPKTGVDALRSPKAGVDALSQSDGVDALVDLPPWAKNSLFPYWLLPKNKKLTLRAKELRRQWILTEVIFWQTFKRQKYFSYDIDRQVIIGNYIVDFFIPELGLVFEIDGSSHIWREEYDSERNAFLIGLWLMVVHIVDTEVKKNIEWVSVLIKESIGRREMELRNIHPTD